MTRFVLICSMCMTFFCGNTAVHDSATLSVGDRESSPAHAFQAPVSDTVIIEKDTTAIDVKQAETAPEIVQPAKPVYSMEMIEHKVEGSVRLKLLVGADGSIKEYIIKNDLGHGTNDAIHRALLKMRFSPARKSGSRVSVWIETTIYFKPPNI